MARQKAEPILGQNRLVAHVLGLATWMIGLIFFFPLFWMVLNGFKEEIDANASPKLFFDPTFARFSEVTAETTGLARDSKAAYEAFKAAGLACDHRESGRGVDGEGIVRLAPAPLFNTFDEVWRAAEIVRGVIAG